MDNGQWSLDNGQWTMDNGQWTCGQVRYNLKHVCISYKFYGRGEWMFE